MCPEPETTPPTTTTSVASSFYLLKSEPSEFSISDLEKCPGMKDEWCGVRNYQARNIMRTMRPHDLSFFYHSSCREPAIVGTVRIVRQAQPDPTALQHDHAGYDPKSSKENCRWDSVQVQLEQVFSVPLTLKEIRTVAATKNSILAGMMLLKRPRLSVQPVTPDEWAAIHELVENKIRNEALAASSDDSGSKEKDVRVVKQENGDGQVGLEPTVVKECVDFNCLS
jgi:predicted RNA-binding protein with PUA-like domain